MKNIKVILSYIVIVLIIGLGFVVGSHTYKYSEGYRLYDYSKKVGNSYSYKEIGDRSEDHYFGWYFFDYSRNREYYEGNIKVPDSTIEKGETYYRIQGVGDSNYNDLHQVYIPQIIISIIIMIIMLSIPAVIVVLKKKRKK